MRAEPAANPVPRYAIPASSAVPCAMMLFARHAASAAYVQAAMISCAEAAAPVWTARSSSAPADRAAFCAAMSVIAKWPAVYAVRSVRNVTPA